MKHDCWKECSWCGNEQCVDAQVESMERNKTDIVETHCKKCGMIITLVFGTMGIQVLETLLKEKQNGI